MKSSGKKYIFHYDDAIIDLMELKENKHLRFVNEDYYIFILYFPANKRLYI